MISILVPVYNTSVYQLIEELSFQLTKHELAGEIIVFDDFSNSYYREQNRPLQKLPFVYYKELDCNQGRIAIRKLLSAQAKYDWLLFIDGDSSITDDNFLLNYFAVMNPDIDIIQGGRIYPAKPPAESSKMLHWLYGSKRELITGKVGGSFHSNNFCIRKSLFDKLLFPEELSGYGHEDTWIGIQMDIIDAKCRFIKNPVLHEGIEPADLFLEKTDNALHNLLKLSYLTDKSLLKKHVRLFNAFSKIKRFKLERLLLFIFKLSRKKIISNLNSLNPSLLFFDWYRLCKLTEIEKHHKKCNNSGY